MYGREYHCHYTDEDTKALRYCIIYSSLDN